MLIFKDEYNQHTSHVPRSCMHPPPSPTNTHHAHLRAFASVLTSKYDLLFIRQFPANGWLQMDPSFSTVLAQGQLDPTNGLRTMQQCV
jgi:hypothetical protein